MGVRGSFTELTPAAFDAIAAVGNSCAGLGPSHSIDKLWLDFHMILGRQGKPLSLTISGDRVPPNGTESIDGLITGSDELYVGLVSPLLVNQISPLLQTVSWKQIEEWGKHICPELHPSNELFWNQMKGIYFAAASKGCGLMITIA